MRFKTALIVLLVVFFSSDLKAHDFYLSVTTVRHNLKNEKLSIRIRLFVNDLEESIFQGQGVRLGLWKNLPIENAECYIEKYIYSNLFISINRIPVEIEFIEQRMKTAEVIEENVIFCELEVCNVSEIYSIGVQNKLLTESFDSQTNIVVVSANGIRNTLNLDKHLSQDEIVYEGKTKSITKIHY